jgi:hypothetical protein
MSTCPISARQRSLTYSGIAVAVLAAMFAEWRPDGQAAAQLLEKASMTVPVLAANPETGPVSRRTPGSLLTGGA